MPLKIAHREQEGIELLELHGRLVLGKEDMTLRRGVEALLAAGKNRIVIDLGGIMDIDTVGLGTLIFSKASCRKAGGRLAFANLRVQHIELMILAKIEREFEFFESDQDAVNSFFPDRSVPHYDILHTVKRLLHGTDPTGPSAGFTGRE